MRSSNNSTLSAAAQLPRTGGAAGTDPSGPSPLAPLGILATLAIVAGRMLPRFFKR
ncbi:MAG: hypothetical protein NVS2B16_17040 [Chloroflexota bacterium]